ncbi:MAG: peptidase M14, partial [Clostridiales bacterium]|nr:peptidase M14 [Clostridiales bacterium]
EIYWRFHQAEPDLSRDRRLAEALASATGYRLIDGDRSSAGGYKDWCVEVLKIPAFTIEIADDRHAHPVPYSALPEESERNRGVPDILLKYLAMS